MAILAVLKEPDARLRQVSKPVDQVSDEIRSFLNDMVETMHAEDGIGLAAPQVNCHKRLIVVQIGDDEPILKMINPEISHKSAETYHVNEGCLSVPEEHIEVKRPQSISVSYLDELGQKQTLNAEDLLSICIQHEIDHLDGKLMIDYLSPLKKAVALKRLRKIKNENYLI